MIQLKILLFYKNLLWLLMINNFMQWEIFLKNAGVTLYIDENENENIKEIPCIIQYESQLKYYELTCASKQAISFHLDNIMGKFANKALIISMDDGANDFINIQIPNNDYGKKSSDKGLNSGEIIGISIVCVVIAINPALITMF